MCLFLHTNNQKKERKIAEKDIICYKTLSANLFPHGETWYDNNKTPKGKKYGDKTYFCFSPFRDYAVEFNRTIKDNCCLDFRNRYFEFYYPFESIDKLCKWNAGKEPHPEGIEIGGAIYGGVFHSFKYLSDTEDFFHNKGTLGYNEGNGRYKLIVECVIPAGTEYYEGVFETTGIPSYGSRSIRYRRILVAEETY